MMALSPLAELRRISDIDALSRKKWARSAAGRTHPLQLALEHAMPALYEVPRTPVGVLPAQHRVRSAHRTGRHCYALFEAGGAAVLGVCQCWVVRGHVAAHCQVLVAGGTAHQPYVPGPFPCPRSLCVRAGRVPAGTAVHRVCAARAPLLGRQRGRAAGLGRRAVRHQLGGHLREAAATPQRPADPRPPEELPDAGRQRGEGPGTCVPGPPAGAQARKRMCMPVHLDEPPLAAAATHVHAHTQA